MNYMSLIILWWSIMIIPMYGFFKGWNLFSNNSFETKSSVSCQKVLNNTKLCKFKNICYDPVIKTFLFFLHQDSIIKGIFNYQELQRIQLSSIHSHNHFYANISVVDVYNFKLTEPKIQEKKGFLLSRFKPDNIMHIIHDDLFPLFLSLEYICLSDENCLESYKLIIHDNYPIGHYLNIYKLFSNTDIILLNKLHTNQILCFEEIITGLVNEGKFFQYGFNEPHGPVNNQLINTLDILRFTNYIKKKLHLNDSKSVQADVVIINRKKSRKILNINIVEFMIKDIYKKIYGNDPTVIILDWQKNEFEYFVRMISKCKVLVGMHGAEMIFSIFNEGNLLVIELFPFGIQPETVSYVKPISKLKNNNIKYMAWRNFNKNNSVAPKNAHAFYGGINHLDDIYQEKIKETRLVPAVKCCNDPTYLYYMYQDTWVSNEFKEFFNEVLLNFANSKNQFVSRQIINEWFHPYIVVNASCTFESDKHHLNIRWSPPFNIKVKKKLRYSFYVKDETNLFVKQDVVQKTNLSFKIPKDLGNCPKFYFWILALFDENNSRSRDVHVSCSCK